MLLSTVCVLLAVDRTKQHPQADRCMTSIETKHMYCCERCHSQIDIGNLKKSVSVWVYTMLETFSSHYLLLDCAFHQESEMITLHQTLFTETGLLLVKISDWLGAFCGSLAFSLFILQTNIIKRGATNIFSLVDIWYCLEALKKLTQQ